MHGWPTEKRRKRPARRRLAALLAYDGTGFRGFQRQPGQRTVEGELVLALSSLGLGEGLSFASRTDAGVHAAGQVVAFRTPPELPLEDCCEALAMRLPADVRLVALAPAPAHFHPRWSALGKRYEYLLALEAVGTKLELALDELRQAPSLDGFTAPGAPAKAAPPLSRLALERRSGEVTLVFEGPAFRRYAIRHMVGAALAQARGDLPPGSCAALATSPRSYHGPRAAPGGLTLMRVAYPPELDPFAQR